MLRIRLLFVCLLALGSWYSLAAQSCSSAKARAACAMSQQKVTPTTTALPDWAQLPATTQEAANQQTTQPASGVKVSSDSNIKQCTPKACTPADCKVKCCDPSKCMPDSKAAASGQAVQVANGKSCSPASCKARAGKVSRQAI